MARGIFEKAWYRPDENQWRNMNMLAMRDSGALVVNDNSLEYHLKEIQIPDHRCP